MPALTPFEIYFLKIYTIPKCILTTDPKKPLHYNNRPRKEQKSYRRDVIRG